MYQALYRKWRPKTFADVVGQEHITETLQRQDDLREDPRARSQLRASGKRQSLQPLPELPWHRERAAARRGRAGRGVEQRRGQRARAA